MWSGGVREGPKAAALGYALKATLTTKGLWGPNTGIQVKGLKLTPTPGISNFSALDNVRLYATL